jgi:ATP-dependent protease ClpP protease subunit
MAEIELLTFSMRKDAPKAGDDWFRIVEGKKGEATKVYIYDEIGYWGTNAKEFAILLNEIETKEIHLHINSPGGSVFDGLAIGAAVKDHPATVTGKVDGMAASAASFILQYCDKREISRNAQVMIHDAKAYAGGNAEQMRKAADLLDRVSDNIADIYAVRSGQGTKASWRETMQSGDTWYDGNEAVEAGLVDVVTDNPEEDEPDEASKNSWTQAEVEAFLVLPAATLAKDTSRSIITNQVEEDLMNQPAPQPVATPPAAQATPPAPAPAPVQTAPATVTFMVNGVESTDMTAVQAHITGLETFKKESIDSGRKNFVKALAAQGKIMAGDDNLTAQEEFALSLSNDQFEKWKASWEATPASTLFGQHGVTPGNQAAPQNGGNATAELDKAIAIQQEIVDGHKAGGMSDEELKEKPSYKALQELLTKKTTQTGV